MASIFDTLDQQAAPAQTPKPTIFDSLPAPEPEEPQELPKTVFDSLPASAPLPTTQPKIAPSGFANKAWDFLNSPLVGRDVIDRAISGNLTGTAQPTEAQTAEGGVKHGLEDFAAGLTSPLSVGLIAASAGGSLVEQGLLKAGLTATDAAAYTQKAKLVADMGFLTKYGYDLGTNTIPQLEMAWGDYRSAKTGTGIKQRHSTASRSSEPNPVLNAVATGFATKGVARDLTEIHAASPKGQAMAQEHYSDGVHGYQEENQLGTSQARQDFDEYTKKIPDDYRRVLIARSIEAGADPNVLEQQALRAEANPTTKDTAKEFRDAKKLSDSEIEVRDELRSKLSGDLAHLKALNLLPEDGGKLNYLPHKWDVDDKDPETGKVVTRTLQDSNSDMLKQRKFDTIAEGEQKGLKPTTKDAVALIADYHEQVSNLIAKNNLGEKLASSYMNDGAPMAAPGHLFPGFSRAKDALMAPEEVEKLKAAGTLDGLIKSGRVYEVPAKPTPEGAMVKAGEAPERQFKWKQSDYVPSGLHVWRPISEAEAAAMPKAEADQIVPFGQPQADKVANARVPVYVHPDIAPHLEPMLESTTPKNALMKAILKASSEAKSDLLALSPFHWATILNRSLEAGMNPFGGTNRKFIFAPKDIDYYNLTPAQSAALRDGVVVSSTRPGFSGYLDEGLASEHDSFINKIPLVGDFNRAIEGRLFGPHGWITSLKLDLYDKLKTEVAKSKPELTDEQAGRIAASQVNNKFGGLNYTVLGRGASTQNALRAFLLAPDFLESSGRSVLDVAGEHGGSLVKSLVAFNVAQWLMTRGINYLVSGDTRPQSGMSVLSKNGKREYNMRTTLGDFLHFAEKPKDFIANRVNPILARAPAEIASGEDEMGNKVTGAQEFFDTLRQITPIPLQGIYPTETVSQPSAGDKLLQSVGVQSRKKFTPAETLAHELMSKRSGEGAALEGDDLAKAQLRYKLEDQLRTAINARDNAGKVAAQRQIHQAAAGPNAKLTAKEAGELIQNANKFPMPIQSTVQRLSLQDSLQVWDQAGITERRALRPLIQAKVEKWMLASSDHTREQNDSMRQRIKIFRMSQ